MRARGNFSLFRLGVMLALASALAACTKGGQFDPTTLLDSDMFDNKKPLPGKRDLVFPQGVPGAATGIPADLYKGYTPPPQQAADAGGAATPILPPGVGPAKSEAQVKPRPKPRLKPKPKLARAPASTRRTEISIGLPKHPKPAGQPQAQPASAAWPASPAAGQARPSQTVWPAPPSTSQAQSSQSIWPAPPPTGGAQPAGQPSQSIWPNPPATGASPQ
jgi:hypothetical protein